jgi:phytanoyl-CoA hydroxylase
MAVDDVDEENGGLSVVTGTHRTDVLCHGGSDPSSYVSKDMLRVPEGIHFIKTELKADDVLFFHGSVVHSAGQNVFEDRFRRVSSFFVSSHPGSCLVLQSLVLHYVSQTSVEVAKFYLPLISPNVEEIMVGESPSGGPCGELVAGY